MGCKVLYISYDGMTDSLGQAQVIPYLKGLVKEGHEIHILSCEKTATFKINQDSISMLLFESGIHWHPLMYTKKPPVFSTFYDIIKLKKKAKALERRMNFDVVHCRSYIAALVGEYLKKKYKTRFIFDIRGFWADERIDGGLWDILKPVYKKIYNYFKKKEALFFNKADAIITLTNASKVFIENNFSIKGNIQVIPCATDFDLFKPQETPIKINYRKKLGIKNEFVLLYLGSIGTWYLLAEMLDFFVELKNSKKDAKFVFISGDEPSLIFKQAEDKGIDRSDIIVKKVNRVEVPAYISVADLSVFFIKPCFSKMASSPTKHGELLACEVPLVCNDIGDLKSIINDKGAGVIVKDFSKVSYRTAISASLSSIKGGLLQETAIKYYSLEEGVKIYNEVYNNLI